MTRPEPFNRLCRGFHQNVYVGASSLDDVVLDALSHANFSQVSDVKELKAFIDELLGEKYTQQELLDTWNEAPGDIYFYEVGGLIQVLRRIRDLLDTYPSLEST